MTRHAGYDPLDETLADLADIKITIDDDGWLTLSGIDYGTFRSIITAASLYRHAEPFVPVVIDPNCSWNETVKENAVESQRWHWTMFDVLEKLHGVLACAIRPGYEQWDSNDEAITLFRKMRKMDLTREPAWVLPDPEPEPPKSPWWRFWR